MASTSDRIAVYRSGSLAAAIACKDIVLTVTSGRSGTRLLAKLCKEVLALDTEHEPEPRANFALRPTLEDPEYGIRWLVEAKLPAIAARASTGTYVETSHLYGKGLIEPLLALGIRPRFVILRFNPSTVARSLYSLNGIPERSIAGRQVLVGPSDRNSLLPFPDWEFYSDYQLCYWYAREIAARQEAYVALFERENIAYVDCELADLLNWGRFSDVARFLTGSPAPETGRQLFDALTTVNQNPKERVLAGAPERALPSDLAAQERAVSEALLTAGERPRT